MADSYDVISADTNKADKVPIRPIVGLTDNRSTTTVSPSHLDSGGGGDPFSEKPRWSAQHSEGRASATDERSNERT